MRSLIRDFREEYAPVSGSYSNVTNAPDSNGRQKAATRNLKQRNATTFSVPKLLSRL
jgi:hypothetical protein